MSYTNLLIFTRTRDHRYVSITGVASVVITSLTATELRPCGYRQHTLNLYEVCGFSCVTCSVTRWLLMTSSFGWKPSRSTWFMFGRSSLRSVRTPTMKPLIVCSVSHIFSCSRTVSVAP